MDALAMSWIRPLAIGAALFVSANEAHADQMTLRVVRTDIGSAVNIVIDSLSTISAGIELESRCAHLPAEMDIRFIESQRTIYTYLETILLPQVINRIHADSSQAVAPPSVCGKESDGFVKESFYLADYLARLIHSRNLN